MAEASSAYADSGYLSTHVFITLCLMSLAVSPPESERA